MIIIFSHSTSPTHNLATEEYLFAERQDDILLLYINEPSVIIGCNQAIQNEVNLGFCRENKIQIVRRMSGGGAVFHDLGNLNFSFISNKTILSALSPDFLNPIIDVLKQLEIPVDLGKRKDLWLHGFKISGTASHVCKTRELHHGTLLYDSDLVKLQKALSVKKTNSALKGIASVPANVKNIRTFLFEQGLDAPVADIFFEKFYYKIKDLFISQKTLTLNHTEINFITNLQNTKYCDQNWTFRK